MYITAMNQKERGQGGGKEKEMTTTMIGFELRGVYVRMCTQGIEFMRMLRRKSLRMMQLVRTIGGVPFKKGAQTYERLKGQRKRELLVSNEAGKHIRVTHTYNITLTSSREGSKKKLV